jgi:hypothetical protein
MEKYCLTTLVVSNNVPIHSLWDIHPKDENVTSLLKHYLLATSQTPRKTIRRKTQNKQERKNKNTGLN